MSEAHKGLTCSWSWKEVGQLTLSEEVGATYASVKDASKTTEVHVANISACARGTKRPQAAIYGSTGKPWDFWMQKQEFWTQSSPSKAEAKLQPVS
jgi:hypothetical protein